MILLNIIFVSLQILFQILLDLLLDLCQPKQASWQTGYDSNFGG